MNVVYNEAKYYLQNRIPIETQKTPSAHLTQYGYLRGPPL